MGEYQMGSFVEKRKIDGNCAANTFSSFSLIFFTVRMFLWNRFKNRENRFRKTENINYTGIFIIEFLSLLKYFHLRKVKLLL